MSSEKQDGGTKTEKVKNQGPVVLFLLTVVVRKVDSVIHRIVIFSTVVKMLESHKNTDTELVINKT